MRPEDPGAEKKTRDGTLDNKPAAPLASGLPDSRFYTGGQDLPGFLDAGLELVRHFKLILENILQPLMDLAQFLGRELLHRSLDLLNLAHRANGTFRFKGKRLDCTVVNIG
jgi:hypothetical protein